jgi:hypothetical protein
MVGFIRGHEDLTALLLTSVVAILLILASRAIAKDKSNLIVYVPPQFPPTQDPPHQIPRAAVIDALVMYAKSKHIPALERNALLYVYQSPGMSLADIKSTLKRVFQLEEDQNERVILNLINSGLIEVNGDGSTVPRGISEVLTELDARVRGGGS